MIHLNRCLVCLAAIVIIGTPLAARKSGVPVRVACVGNSVTYGYGLQHRERDAYPVRLQELLGSGFEVGNFGHSGSTLLFRGHRPYVQQPEFRQAMDFRADWVVIHLGLNDTDPRNWPDWKEEFVPNYRALIDSFRVANPKARILICLMTPIFDRHPRFQSGTRDWHQQIQQAISTVAAGAGVQLIDLNTPLHNRPDLFPDALHPNAEGAQILANTVYSALTGNYGGLKLPAPFTDGMVLQRDQPLSLHGRANAGAVVTVSIDGHSVSAVCGNDGIWRIQLPAHNAGGPYEFSVEARRGQGRKADVQTIRLHDVYYGDVWLASGQSNMEFMVSQSDSRQQDLKDAEHASRLHLLNLASTIARTDAVQWSEATLAEVNSLRYLRPAVWQQATPQSVDSFSSVAYNFGRTLLDSLPDVHIGIICNAVGGSTTESWIDRTTLEYSFPNILSNWIYADYGQPWARSRAAQNISLALNKQSAVHNPLQRHPYDPCYLFEAGIAPLEQFPIKGVIWYQGESNAHNIEVHARLFTLLEQSWRNEWNDPALPFYTVQLSSLSRTSWPAFRESQRELAATLPHTQMVVSSDLGDSLDVHYRTKRPVGERLALQALNHTYGHSLVCEGPVLTSANMGGSEAILTFANADGLLCSRGFEVASSDGLYHPAVIAVSGNSVTLSAPGVSSVKYVRYGWRGYTDADLRNSQGLPASTFCIK